MRSSDVWWPTKPRLTAGFCFSAGPRAKDRSNCTWSRGRPPRLDICNLIAYGSRGGGCTVRTGRRTHLGIGAIERGPPVGSSGKTFASRRTRKELGRNLLCLVVRTRPRARRRTGGHHASANHNIPADRALRFCHCVQQVPLVSPC